MPAEGVVYVVDDDADLRDSLVWLIRSVGLEVEAFGSPAEFLAGYDGRGPACLVADVRMPGMSGIELHERLRAGGVTIPAVIITGHADVPTAVRALKSGAAEFLEKPFDRQSLLEKVQRALQEDARRRADEARWEEAERRLARLTEKEREVLQMLADGRPNKVIAAQLGIGERAVEMRRAAVMRKLEAASLAEALETLITHRLVAGMRRGAS